MNEEILRKNKKSDTQNVIDCHKSTKHTPKKNYEKKYIHDKFKPFLKEKMR